MATKGNGEMDLPSFVRSYVISYSKNGIRWSKAKASYESEVCCLIITSIKFAAMYSYITKTKTQMMSER